MRAALILAALILAIGAAIKSGLGGFVVVLAFGLFLSGFLARQ